jgi:tetratricopeptide (TPR) repeat protein
VHRQIGDQGDLCAVLFELGNVAAQRGELQRALDFYDESARVAEVERIHYYLALARNNFAYHSLLLGRVNEAQQSVAQGIKIAEAYDLLAALLHLYSTKGEIYLYLDQWNEAKNRSSGLALAENLAVLSVRPGIAAGWRLRREAKRISRQRDICSRRHLLSLLSRDIGICARACNSGWRRHSLNKGVMMKRDNSSMKPWKSRDLSSARYCSNKGKSCTCLKKFKLAIRK